MIGKRASYAAAAALLGLLSTGCFLRLSTAYIDPYGDGQLRFESGLVNCASTTSSSASAASTAPSTRMASLEITSTADLIADYGLFGALIDPVVLQVPEDVTVIQGTYDREGRSGHSRSGGRSCSTRLPGETVVAEPGHVFLILDLPADAAADVPDGDAQDGPTFGFTLSFRVPNHDLWRSRRMFTAHVVEDGRDFYPPLLPCTTDFAQVPSFEIPMAFTGENIGPAIVDLARELAPLACQDRVYQFATGPSHAALRS